MNNTAAIRVRAAIPADLNLNATAAPAQNEPTRLADHANHSDFQPRFLFVNSFTAYHSPKIWVNQVNA